MAAIALGLGAVSLGALTTPDPEAAPESTTTTAALSVERPVDMGNFTVAEIAVGEPLVWRQSESVADGYPISLIEHEGWLYLFTTDTPSVGISDEGGLIVWRSEDGRSWESLGQVIDRGHLITQVEATAQGLMALESDIRGGGSAVWRSRDGLRWSPEELPIADASDHLAVYPQAIGGNDSVLVVVGNVGLGVLGLLEDRLEQHLGFELDLTNLGWSTDLVDGDFVFQVWGPLGFPLLEISGSDLGLSEADSALVQEDYTGQGNTDLWVSTDGGDWQQIDFPEMVWAESIVTATTGEIFLTGSGTAGQATWSSYDGFNWEQLGPTLRPYSAERWGEGLVGPSTHGRGSLLASGEGHTWKELGPADAFPLPIQWNVDAMATGPGGVAAWVHGWGHGDSAPVQLEPSVIVVEGATLTIDFMSGVYSVEGGGTTSTWSMHTSERPEGIEIDLSDETITFSDKISSEELATVGIGQIRKAEYDYWSSQGAVDQYQALMYTPDGESWIIQDATAALGEEAWPQWLELTNSTVVAVVVSPLGAFSARAPTGFEIWAAPIP